MGNCVEERGVPSLVSEIMKHTSNASRDLPTQHSLHTAFRKRSTEELKRILDGIKHGKFLPDSFK